MNKIYLKDNSYERLVNKPDKIDIVLPKTDIPTIVDDFKNPIMLNLDGNVVINEKELKNIKL